MISIAQNRQFEWNMSVESGIVAEINLVLWRLNVENMTNESLQKNSGRLWQYITSRCCKVQVANGEISVYTLSEMAIKCDSTPSLFHNLLFLSFLRYDNTRRRHRGDSDCEILPSGHRKTAGVCTTGIPLYRDLVTFQGKCQYSCVVNESSDIAGTSM